MVDELCNLNNYFLVNLGSDFHVVLKTFTEKLLFLKLSFSVCKSFQFCQQLTKSKTFWTKMISKLVFTKVGFGFAIIPSNKFNADLYISNFWQKKNGVTLRCYRIVQNWAPWKRIPFIVHICVYNMLSKRNCCPIHIFYFDRFYKMRFFFAKNINITKKTTAAISMKLLVQKQLMIVQIV